MSINIQQNVIASVMSAFETECEAQGSMIQNDEFDDERDIEYAQQLSSALITLREDNDSFTIQIEDHIYEVRITTIV